VTGLAAKRRFWTLQAQCGRCTGVLRGFVAVGCAGGFGDSPAARADTARLRRSRIGAWRINPISGGVRVSGRVAAPFRTRRFRGRGRGVDNGTAWLRRGELTGFPEQEDLFQVGENAGEASHDDGVHGRGEAKLGGVLLSAVAQPGDRIAEGGGMRFHS